MKTLLLFPPGWNPHAPYLALPLLAARLKAAGRDVRVFDANVDFLDRILTREFLTIAVGRLAEVGEQDDPMTAMATMMAPDLIAHVEAAKLGFRSRNCFADREQYEWCRRMLAASLNLVSSAWPGLRLTLQSIQWTTHGTVASSSVLEAVRDPKANIFRDYFDSALLPMLRDGRFGLVGLSVTDRDQLIPAMTIAARIRETFGRELPIVFGGNYFSRLARGWREPHRFHEFVDYTIVGEGENAIVELAEALEGTRRIEEVSNLCYVRGGTLQRTAPGTVDIESTPFADFDDLPLDKYFSPEPILPTYSTRSCSWSSCAFCTIPSTSGAFRMRSGDRIAAELEHLRDRHSVSHFTFIDESLPPGIVRRFSRAIVDRGLDVRWYGETRMVPGFNDELFALAHRAGARLIQFGLESYNQRVLDRIHKGIRVPDIEPLLERCLRQGIAFHLFCMIGFPGETEEEALSTLAFASRIIGRAAGEFGNDCCSKGISTFGLEQGSIVEQRPADFGVTVLEPDPRCDLQLDRQYEVEDGLSAADAAALVDRYAGVDVYRHAMERLHLVCANRMLAPGAAREEETFIRWASHGSSTPASRVWPREWDAPAPGARQPWIRIVTGENNPFSSNGERRGRFHFAVDSRRCRVQPLTDDECALLSDSVAPAGPGPLVRRMTKLGLLRCVDGGGGGEFVRPHRGVSLICLPPERYVLFDGRREEASAVNSTGAMIWQMMTGGTPAGQLLARVQELYGSGFTAEHLETFLDRLAAGGMIDVA